jgi:hypothetical protein
MLKGAGLAAAAGAAALVVAGKATPAGAIVDPSLILNEANLSSGNTEVRFNGSDGAAKVIFLANDTGFQPANTAYNAALAGWGGGNSGATTQVGVYGYCDSSEGIAVVGRLADGTGVLGQATASGAALEGDGQGEARGLIATSTANQAIWAHIDNASSSATSLRAETAGSGSGVFGVSTKGVGGKFQGKTAQIQLIPSTSSSHPTSGSAGQLFYDNSNRLWLCKGGTNWHQLA